MLTERTNLLNTRLTSYKVGITVQPKFAVRRRDQRPAAVPPVVSSSDAASNAELTENPDSVRYGRARW